jgi:hypothetical protein
MHRTVNLILFSLCVLLFSPTGGSAEDSSYRKAPRALLEAWLRFHEAALCQGIDAAFEFSESGMKVRSQIEDEKSFQKFEEMLEPLKSSFQIELEASHPSLEKKDKKSKEDKDSDNDRNPPPSLWENYELRYNLGDSFAQIKDRYAFEEVRNQANSDEILKQRLYMYASQILDWKKKMQRYASELSNFARVFCDPAISPDLRARANALCLAHAQELGKIIIKLNSSLSLAIPKSNEKRKAPASAGIASKSTIDFSLQIAESACALARQIDRFLHPEQFTVELNDLRQPSLLDSINNLSKMDSDFLKEIGKSAKSK